MRVFILEDSDLRNKAFMHALQDGPTDLVIAHTVAEAKQRWDPPYDIVLLDHDLTPLHYSLSNDPDLHYPIPHEDTGYAFCQWLVALKGEGGAAAQPKDADLFVVHSMNYSGARAMMAQLALADLPATLEMFSGKLLSALKLRLKTEREQWAT